jgi:hypothetical protein
MARKQLSGQWAEHRRRRDEEERRQRVMVITEFDAGDPEATLHALAAEIPDVPPRQRRLAGADAGAPVALIAPGPLLAAKLARVTGSDARSPEMPAVPPPA